MLDAIRDIDPLYMIMGLAGVCIVLFLLIVVLLVKVGRLKKRYQQFMSGSNGKSLEGIILENFDVMNDIVREQRRIDQDMNKVRREYAQSFSKMKVYKYNAFPDMGGDTSFVIALLDENNNGTLLNGMNAQNGTYMYAKEVVNGTSQIALSKEEIYTLEECMNQ